MERQPAIYIVTNSHNTVLYTGVTSDLAKRIYEHKTHAVKGFTQKYNCEKLVYYEIYERMEQAILREKQLKAGSRKKKEMLINETNPEWGDLYGRIVQNVPMEIATSSSTPRNDGT